MLEDNPVKKARESLGLGRADFAMKLGKSYPAVSGAELGHVGSIGASWEPGLEALGIPYAPLRDAYRTWRQARAVAPVAEVARG